MELGPANTNQSIRFQRENVRNVKASSEKLSSGSRTVSGGDAGGWLFPASLIRRQAGLIQLETT